MRGIATHAETGAPARRARRTDHSATRAVLLGAALLALALPGLAGCHSGARSLSTEAQATRVALDDFSILPPDGPGWLVASQQADAVVFGRRSSPTHSEVALASGKKSERPIANQAELLTYVREDWAASHWQTAARYSARKTDLQADSRLGPYCVHYRLQSEDHGAPNRGAAPYLVQRSLGLICYDPRRPGRLIHAGFTERALPSESSLSFDKQAERFLDSLEITSLADGSAKAAPATGKP